MVFKLTTDNISIFFTGDMTEESERLLLNKGADVNADILKTAHHGSNYSSCEEFIEAVSPGLCIISCGVSNLTIATPIQHTVVLICVNILYMGFFCYCRLM